MPVPRPMVASIVLATFNKVYRTDFKKEFPARAFIGAGTLLLNARFEMQGIAVKR